MDRFGERKKILVMAVPRGRMWRKPICTRGRTGSRVECESSATDSREATSVYLFQPGRQDAGAKGSEEVR